MSAVKHGRSEEQACSTLAAGADESVYGSAAQARAWVAVEQRGPWGPDAARQSHLDPELGHALATVASQAGGRLALIRPPGRHPDDSSAGPRQVFVAFCQPGLQWLLSVTVPTAEAVLDLDSAALANGDREAVAASLTGSVAEPGALLLVCTNGRRDLCCAVRGRPVAIGAAAARPGQVWETSHTGGHRFAPTAVLLPSGVSLGRLSAGSAVTALDAVAAGRFPLALAGPRFDRGRCWLSPAAQAAESAVRLVVGEERLDALRVVEPALPPRRQAAAVAALGVEHVDGPRWQALVRWRTGGRPRPLSCGKAAEPRLEYDVELIPGEPVAVGTAKAPV